MGSTSYPLLELASSNIFKFSQMNSILQTSVISSDEESVRNAKDLQDELIENAEEILLLEPNMTDYFSKEELLSYFNLANRLTTTMISEGFNESLTKDLQLKNEQKEKIHSLENLWKFAKNVEKNRENLVTLLRSLKIQGKKIAAVSAPAKGMTLLNYCKIGADIIDYICDTTDEKINKYSPGMHIPIVPIKHFRENIPDIAYLFAWNHKKEIFEKEKN